MKWWYYFRIGTQNLGRIRVFQVLNAMRGLAVLCMQEASDRGDVLEALAAAGYGIIRFDKKTGQAATPMAYDPTQVKLLWARVYPLFPGGGIGPGTGPDHGKPKWLYVVCFRDLATGRRIIVANLHLYAGQAMTRRRRIAFGMVVRVLLTLRHLTAIVILCGDFNADPITGKATAPLRATPGWRCNHIVGGEVPTHGRASSPDQIWWRSLGSWVRQRIRFVTQMTRSNNSDHQLLVVTFSILKRKRWDPRGKGGRRAA